MRARGRNADFLAVLFEPPYCRIAKVTERRQVSHPTAMAWLNPLVEVDSLRSLRLGRDRLSQNPRSLHVLVRDVPPTATPPPF